MVVPTKSLERKFRLEQKSCHVFRMKTAIEFGTGARTRALNSFLLRTRFQASRNAGLLPKKYTEVQRLKKNR